MPATGSRKHWLEFELVGVRRRLIELIIAGICAFFFLLEFFTFKWQSSRTARVNRKLKREAQVHANTPDHDVDVNENSDGFVNKLIPSQDGDTTDCTSSPKFGSQNPLPSNHVTDTNIRISIIIAIKNESRVIGKTLRNLEATTKCKNLCEIIIVDKGCVDNSIDVAKASSCCIKVTFIRSTEGMGRGSALNAGAAIATGNVLLFLRSDCLVPDSFDEVSTFHLSPYLTLLYLVYLFRRLLIFSCLSHLSL